MMDMITDVVDVPTLAFTRGLVQILLAGLLLYLGNKEIDARGARLWAAGFLLNGISLLAFALNVPEAWVSTMNVVNHMALGASSVFLLAGFWRFGQQAILPWALAALVLVPAISLLLFEWLWPNARFRIITTASGQVLFLALLQWALRQAPRQELARIYRRLRYLVIAYALIVIWSYTSVVDLLPTTARVSTDYHRVFFSVSSLLFMLSLAVGCLALQFSLLAARSADLAKVDWLTGCLNRRGFFARLQALEAGRAGEHSPISVVTMDLDHFKSINDRFGHAVGDQVLREFGGILNGYAGPESLVARLGGEEFCVVMPGADQAQALAMARAVQTSCGQMRVPSTKEGVVTVSASLGVLEVPPDISLEAAMNRVDRLLYQAKARGRNRIETAFATGA